MKAKLINEVQNFTRGQGSKKALGVGKYVEFSKFWNSMMEKNPSPTNFIEDFAMQLVTILRRDTDTTAWVRSGAHDEMSSKGEPISVEYLSADRGNGSVKLGVDSDYNLYVSGNTYENQDFIKEVELGNVSNDPGILIKTIDEMYKKLTDISIKKRSEENKEEYLTAVTRALGRLTLLVNVDHKTYDEIWDEAQKTAEEM